MDLMYIVQVGYINESISNISQDTGHIYRTPIQYNPALTIPYLVIIILAAVAGTFGNILIIVAVYTSKELRTIANMFIVNLALADICITTIIDPFSVVGIVLGERWFLERAWLCTILGWACYVVCVASLLNIGAIAFNRYIHICHDSKYSRIFTYRKTLYMCIGLWLTSCVASLPNFVGWGGFTYDKHSLICVYARFEDYAYTIISVAVGVFAPIVLISLSYLRIFLFVQQSKTKISQMRSKVQDSNGKEKRNSVRLARTLFIIFATFSGTWLPYAVISIADRYGTYPPGYFFYATGLAHCSSSINWILYGATNVQFRRSYFRLLRLDRFFNGKLLHSIENSNSKLEENSAVKTVASAVE